MRPSDASRRREAIPPVALAGFNAGISIHAALVNRLMRALGERGLVLAADAPGRLLFLAVAVAPH